METKWPVESHKLEYTPEQNNVDQINDLFTFHYVQSWFD